MGESPENQMSGARSRKPQRLPMILLQQYSAGMGVSVQNAALNCGDAERSLLRQRRTDQHLTSVVVTGTEGWANRSQQKIHERISQDSSGRI
ncbi:MAG: hypothetical protein ACO3FE_03790 [Planctomycetaceae bacterium]